MTQHYVVDSSDRRITDDDLACWLLFYLEAHGVEVVLNEDRSLCVDLNPVLGLDEGTASRWGPVVALLIPAFREILLARRAAALASTKAR